MSLLQSKLKTSYRQGLLKRSEMLKKLASAWWCYIINVEPMARFVDEHQCIRDELLQFYKPLRMTGYHLAEEIKFAL